MQSPPMLSSQLPSKARTSTALGPFGVTHSAAWTASILGQGEKREDEIRFDIGGISLSLASLQSDDREGLVGITLAVAGLESAASRLIAAGARVAADQSPATDEVRLDPASTF